MVSKVTPQERTLYDDAIKKASKVLKFYPESRWVDDALWLIGKSYFNMGDYLLADKKFRELVTNHPESKFADDSYYYLGLCQLSLGHNDAALSAFSEIQNEYKKSDYIDDIAFVRGDMEMTSENYDEAINYFDQYLNKYSGKDSAARAMFLIGQCYEKSNDANNAFLSYSKVKSYNPGKDLYFDATISAASAVLRADSIAIGMKILEDLSKDQKYFSKSAQIKLRIAEGHFLEKNIDRAIEEYNSIAEKFPRTAESAEAYYWLGLIHQNDKFDLKSAKESFAKAQSEFPTSEFKNLALARSAQIAKFEMYQLQLQRADSLERMDTIKSMEVESPASPDSISASSDSAVVSILSDSTAVSKSVSQADSSKAAADSVNSPQLVITEDTLRITFDSLQISQQPSSSSSDTLLTGLDSLSMKDSTSASPLQDSIALAQQQTREDSIKQSIIDSGIETRFLLAELYAYELNRPDTALREYLLIADQHPGSPFAAKSLLAAAFLEFNRGDSTAGLDYLNRLVDQHPRSPLAFEAAILLKRDIDLSINATALYSAAESLANSGQNPDSAILLYKFIAANYPDIAPQAGYAVAHTLAEIKNVEDSTAYFAFQEIEKKYPQTAYAEAAKIKLGKSKPTGQSRPIPKQESAEEPGDKTLPDSAMIMARALPKAPAERVKGEFLYPEALLARDLRGEVLFKIKLDIAGKVIEHEIIGPSGEYVIDSSATAALLRTEFITSQLDIIQLESYFQYGIRFERPRLDLYNDPYRDQRERNIGN